MSKKSIILVASALLVSAAASEAGCLPKCLRSGSSTEPSGQQGKSEHVEAVLQRLNKSTSALKSYECRIEYLFRQPLFESRTLRKGFLYYRRDDDGSVLRINFEKLKQDDEKEQKYVEQFILKGNWLTHIDYQLKQVKMHQLADPNELDPNKPVDVFEVISSRFPIVGFSKVEDLKKQFEISLAGRQNGSGDFTQLHLKVRPDSLYKDDYTSIAFWIDNKTALPAKIVAVSTEEDIYEIKFIRPKINKKISDKVFRVEIPRGFGKPEIVPFDANAGSKKTS